MTTEPTQPSAEAGQAQAAAPGQSQGHRRRRRRRKTKANLAAHQNQPTANGQPQTAAPQPSAPPAPRPPQQQSFQQGGQNGQGQPGQGQGRKKKKSPKQQTGGFQPQPGNSINGSNGGGKKRRQQKGPRQFVGPMDHSYRAVNGNVADGPPSTIPTHSNGGGGGGNGNIAYYNDSPRTIPVIAENAPTRIFFFVEDLFFLAKIQEVSRKLGVKVEFVKGDKEVLARITDAPEAERPTLLVFDLNNAAVKPLTIIPKLKAKLKKSTSIIGFLSHLQGDLKMKATEAGCDTVMPRSAFSQGLPNLLRRYGMDEEDEYYPQPM